MREYLKGAVEAVDAKKEKMLEPVDRLRKLLSSKDKKETLLEMAGTHLDGTGCSAVRGVGQLPNRTQEGDAIEVGQHALGWEHAAVPNRIQAEDVVACRCLQAGHGV
jgi:hypothetical protein